MKDNEQTAMIPYFIHEGETNRLERVNRRLWILAIIIFVAFIVTNAAWIIYETQYQDELYTYEIRQDAGDGGTATYTGNTVTFKEGVTDNGEAND